MKAKIASQSRKIKMDPTLQIKVSNGHQELYSLDDLRGKISGQNKTATGHPTHHAAGGGMVAKGNHVDEEDEANQIAAGHKKRPNTGSATNAQFRQSFKRTQ